METVTVGRTYDVGAETLSAAIADVETFYDAAGFEVSREGTHLELVKRLAVARFELEVRLRDDDAALSYEMVDGPFDAMETRYLVDGGDGESRLTIETTFDAPSSGFGTFINGALIKRQRKSELDAAETMLTERAGASEQ